MESYTKPTNYHNFSNFLKNHQSFPDKKGKSLKDMLVGAKKKGNPLSPNIHIQILQTELYTFPLRMS